MEVVQIKLSLTSLKIYLSLFLLLIIEIHSGKVIISFLCVSATTGLIINVGNSYLQTQISETLQYKFGMTQLADFSGSPLNQNLLSISWEAGASAP